MYGFLETVIHVAWPSAHNCVDVSQWTHALHCRKLVEAHGLPKVTGEGRATRENIDCLILFGVDALDVRDCDAHNLVQDRIFLGFTGDTNEVKNAPIYLVTQRVAEQTDNRIAA